MELHLKIIGIFLICLALIHIIFPKYFNWKQELASLSLFNRQVMQVHTFFIAFTVFLMGILCAFCSHDLVTTPLGRKIAMGLGLFWFIRLLIQFFGYSTELWKGKIFETTVHIFFSVFWMYLTTVFTLVYLNR
ncbi:hypothetical protein NAT51_06800 [Flavobacterium amniphilum]|uniref:hypothetical protein n=1 Tax=Flavobacterium amniphilum TaxID=1834035 RepID=UPI002029F40A|nr:hypothetical protein [Flavobacterium amniphilum]MCL9805221.1 hypothetical protein [Flavobacterium amniphilum]